MGLFDSIQNIISGFTDSVQGSVGDAIGGLGEVPVVQDIQEQATVVTDGITDSANSVVEQGQTLVDDIAQIL